MIKVVTFTMFIIVTTLNTKVMIASITVGTQDHILLLKRPHANPNQAIPNAIDMKATAYMISIIVFFIMDLVSGVSSRSFASVRLEMVSNSELMIGLMTEAMEYEARIPVTPRIIPLINERIITILTESGRLFCMFTLCYFSKQ